jgi:ribosomal protein S18 acetylase RimI-like enzyme
MAQDPVFEILNPQLHNREGFSCGVQSLDDYFRRHARQDHERRLAGVFVLRKANTDDVIGYFTLSSTEVDARALPSETVKKLGRYPVFPAILLGRLAVDSRYRGQGFGKLLLTNALQRSYHNEIGSAFVVVDPIDPAAAAFYTKYDFRPLRDHGNRLHISMGTIKAGLTGG